TPNVPAAFKNGNPQPIDARRSIRLRGSNRMTLSLGAFMPADICPTQNQNLSQSRARRLLCYRLRSRWVRRPARRVVHMLPQRRTGTHIRDIHNPVPLAVELPGLLLVSLKQQGNGIFRPGILGMNRSEIEPAARNR